MQAASKAGQDIRPVGCDIQAKDTVLKAGTLLGPAEIGILASVGAAQVQVAPHWCIPSLTCPGQQAAHSAELCMRLDCALQPDRSAGVHLLLLTPASCYSAKVQVLTAGASQSQI